MRIILWIMLFASVTAVEGAKEWEEVFREFMRGAELDHYLGHSIACIDAIDATGKAIQRMSRVIDDTKQENATAQVYPDVILSTTDLMATFGPLARQCFYTSIEAKEDFKKYTDQFESFSDYVGVFGTYALMNYNELKELFNTFLYDINYIHNPHQAAFHLGSFLNLLLNVKPPPAPQTATLEAPLTHEPEEYKDNGEKAALKKKVDGIYEAVYLFLTTMEMVDGIQLDSCKYYAGELANKIYEGSHIIKDKTRKDNAEGIFRIIDSLEFLTGSVLYCVNSVEDMAKRAKIIGSNFEAKEIPEKFFKNMFFMISDVFGFVATIHFDDYPHLTELIGDFMARVVVKPIPDH